MIAFNACIGVIRSFAPIIAPLRDIRLTAVQIVIIWSTGVDQQLVLGGAGVFDAMVFSGILGVVLCELIGELAERISRGNKPPDPDRIENPIKQKGDKA